MAQKIKLKKEPLLIAKYKALSYQEEAVNAIKDLDYSAIFHEQGLGKSKIAIDLMLYWIQNQKVDTVLYVAKKSLLANCEREFTAHTHMRPKILSQNKKENFYVFNSPSRLILTSYEVFKTEEERLKLFLKTRNVAVILDESAKIKNPKSTLSQVMLKLAPLFKKRVIMTGTPVANRPYDIWSQIYFLDQGEHLGDNFSQFKDKMELSKKLKDEKDSREDFENSLQSLYEKIDHFCVRETKSGGIVNLPAKEYVTINVDWEPGQYDLYQRIKKEAKAVVLKEGILQEDISESILKRLLRLVQVASNPALVDQGYNEQPGKIIALFDLLDKIFINKDKCIIWTSFTGTADWLCCELKKFGVCKIHGKMPIKDRNNSVEKFLTNEEKKILIATPGAAKEGLTLTVANHVIYYDRNFSLDDYLQSQDRIHRISQTKTCYVYKMIMNNSIDEWIDSLLVTKHLAAQLAQGDISLSDYRKKVSYDFGEILQNILGEK